jgi:CRISPR/Cas system CMR-associated protein Cmr1 (group 7 of RAMP superfamily)
MLGAPFKIGLGIFQNIKANKIKPKWEQYQTNPYAQKRLGAANNLFNSRMAGAAEMERNLFSNQASAIGNVNKNATDASQALAAASGIGANTNQAFGQLQNAEMQNKYAMLNNLNQAYAQMVNEGDKVHNSKMQKFQMDTAQKNALRNSGIQNIFSGVDSIDAAIQNVAGMFMGGGLPMGSQQGRAVGGGAASGFGG